MKKIYIEAGANNGIFQSRSFALENNEEFLGILIEPIPEMFIACQRNRPNSLCYNCALVDFEYNKQYVDIHIHQQHYAMATITKAVNEKYRAVQKVPARTLDSILEENNITVIDYFFLDVEGYEINVLKGIDFNQRHFETIEIECHYDLMGISKKDEINTHKEYLEKYGYRLIDKITDQGNLKLIFYYGNI